MEREGCLEKWGRRCGKWAGCVAALVGLLPACAFIQAWDSACYLGRGASKAEGDGVLTAISKGNRFAHRCEGRVPRRNSKAVELSHVNKQLPAM